MHFKCTIVQEDHKKHKTLYFIKKNKTLPRQQGTRKIKEMKQKVPVGDGILKSIYKGGR